MSASVAVKHRLALPSELMLFFKSLVGVESIGRRIKPEFDILAHVTDYAKTLLEERYSKQNIFQDSALILRESQTLISQFPRQAMQLMRKLNNPNGEWKLAVRESDALRTTIAASFNLLFLGIVIAALIFSSALIYSAGHARQEGAALALFISAAALSVIAFVNYIRK
jgi:ubiquinone biosynthesis protein